MSQRNPMNERYTSEERTGTTRKSPASAKPKAKAAASVTVKSAKKTPEQRKAEEKAARKAAAAKQREVERKYYKPDTPRYKRLRLIWWILLIAAHRLHDLELRRPAVAAASGGGCDAHLGLRVHHRRFRARFLEDQEGARGLPGAHAGA